MKKKILITAAVMLILAVAGGGIFAVVSGSFSKGNLPKYLPEKMQVNEDSPIKGKKVIFLGSSVTKGYAALGKSFVDFLERRDGIEAVKEAVSGTTLADTGKNSYVSRLKKIEKSEDVFCFICQLSTNDANKDIPIGRVSESRNINDFDTSTVAGAMEFIIAYAKENFNCPAAFYTGTRFDSENYAKMVDLLYEIQKKWNIDIIDLWNSEKMNAVTKEDYDLFMADPVHPTLAGYGLWWLPEFENYLFNLSEKENSK